MKRVCHRAGLANTSIKYPVLVSERSWAPKAVCFPLSKEEDYLGPCLLARAEHISSMASCRQIIILGLVLLVKKCYKEYLCLNIESIYEKRRNSQQKA